MGFNSRVYRQIGKGRCEMSRHARVLLVTGALLLCPSLALAQSENLSPDNRPAGFMLEVDIAVSTPVYSELMMELGVTGLTSIVPQLALGAQFGRFGVGLRTGISYFGWTQTYDGEEEKWNTWVIRIGPHVDGEIWGSGRGALYLYGGLDVLIYAQSDEDDEDDEPRGIGFSADFGIGGRIYIARAFSIGIQVGTAVDATFWKHERWEGETDEWHTVVWSLYGALAFRFVAAR